MCIEMFVKPPEEAEPWNGTLDATEDGANCIQLNVLLSTTAPYFEGDEDCLYLNVYVPRKLFNDDESLTPVIIFVHGGGFQSCSGGSNDFSPHRFMDKDIILVSMNYRLGPFGFLSTGDDSAPGNYGLLDQLLAMKWVNRHIKHFGGDPNKVTLFGQSAGAGSAALHILSPLSKGLFHSAILQSGTALSEWAVNTIDCSPRTNQLASMLDCPTSPTDQLIKCLRRRPALDIIIKTTQLFYTNLMRHETVVNFQPTVDKSRGANAFLPDDPRELLLKGDISTVPIISGINKDEGLLLYLMMSTPFGGTLGSASELLKGMLPIAIPSVFRSASNGARVLEKLSSVHLTNEKELDINQKTVGIANIFTGDWAKSADDYNELMAKRGAPVYAFKLTYRGSQSLLERFPEYSKLPEGFMDDLKLVCHGDELQYFFRTRYFKTTQLLGTDVQMANIMLTLWANFAINNKPTLEKDKGEFTKWLPTDIGHPTYLDLNLNPQIINDHLNDDYDLWNEIYEDQHNIKTEL